MPGRKESSDRLSPRTGHTGQAGVSAVVELWEKTENVDLQGGEAGILRHPLVLAIS